MVTMQDTPWVPTGNYRLVEAGFLRKRIQLEMEEIAEFSTDLNGSGYFDNFKRTNWRRVSSKDFTNLGKPFKVGS